MTAPYLDALNPEQRLAVEYGIATLSPLLVVAGAGTGKTNTLAHRVAHLTVQGTDPRRIMLLTFSRRAAGEMGRRVERICGSGFSGSGPADRRRLDLVWYIPCHRFAATARIR